MKSKIFLIIILIIAAFLRLNQITSLPALNADEAALGYNAYSLLETGRDEHGNAWPLVFKSFGDYKPGVYVYLVMPFVKLFGLNVLAVRSPGVISSLVSVLLVYLLTKELLLRTMIIGRNGQLAIPAVATLLLAISPWHIHFSRGAWETQVGTTFLLFGVYVFLLALKNSKWYLWFVVSFVLAIYTYHSMRLIAPLLGFGLVIIYWHEVKETIILRRNGQLTVPTWPLFSLIGGVLLLIPFFLTISTSTGLSRAKGVSIFADIGPIARVNEARGFHTQNWNNPLVKLIYNKPIAYALSFAKNYADHFSGNFLFIDGDEIERNKVPEFGQIYLACLPFLLIGLLYLLANIKLLTSKLLFFWLLISPIAASLTFQSPHALRAFNMVVPLTIITAMGVWITIEWTREKVSSLMLTTFCLLLVTSFIWDFSRYLHQYYKLMVPTYPFSSQYGFAELVSNVESVKNQYDRIFVTDRYDQPYILFLFYSQYSPQKFQEQVILTLRDKFGFSTVRDYDKYHFEEIHDFDSLKSNYPNSLIIGTPEEIPDSANIISTIYLQKSTKKLFQIVKI